jgi:hypothetical protein
MEKAGKDFRINTRAGNGRTNTHDDHNAERKDDALAQFRYLETVGEGRKHIGEKR